MRSPNVFGIFSVQISRFFNGNIRFGAIFVGSIEGYMVFLLNASQLAIVCGLGGLSALLHFEVPAARRGNSKGIPKTILKTLKKYSQQP